MNPTFFSIGATELRKTKVNSVQATYGGAITNHLSVHTHRFAPLETHRPEDMVTKLSKSSNSVLSELMKQIHVPPHELSGEPDYSVVHPRETFRMIYQIL